MQLRALILLGFALLAGHAVANHPKTTYGYIEKATLIDQNLMLSAKLDTGAKSASLNAEDITEIDIDGVPYLHFMVPSKTGGASTRFQCEYVGKINIKVRAGEMQSTASHKRSIKRPVVLMRIKLADEERMIRVNLTNRKRFIYPLLLGREAIIAFNGIVDPSMKYTIQQKTDTK
jgi:hypothetical protein